MTIRRATAALLALLIAILLLVALGPEWGSPPRATDGEPTERASVRVPKTKERQPDTARKSPSPTDDARAASGDHQGVTDTETRDSDEDDSDEDESDPHEMQTSWTSAPADPSAPPGMTSYRGTGSSGGDATASGPRTLGVDRATLDAHLERVGRDGVKEGAYERALLIQTPPHEVEVDAFALARHELTNEQWRVFLLSTEVCQAIPANHTLEQLAIQAWQLNADTDGKAIQAGWRYLMDRNWNQLERILNPEGDEDWDPLVAQAQNVKLPGGIELAYTIYLPPPQLRGDPELRLVVVPGEERMPARFVSWEAAMAFCRWAGLHVPREREWAHAVRGTEGRLYAWGDEWKPWRLVWRGYNQALAAEDGLDTATRDREVAELGLLPVGDFREPTGPAPVDTHPQTPEGLFHAQGNVSEWVLEPATAYPGSSGTFAYWDLGRLARGGSYDEHGAFLLASDRTNQGAAPHLNRVESVEARGLRPAAYSLPGRDLTVPLMEPFHAWTRTSGPHTWHPTPPGMSPEQREPTKRHLQQPFKGFDDSITAGVLERHVRAGEPGDPLLVTHAAKGVALLPVKGIHEEALTSADDLRRLAATGEDDEAIVLLGVLTGTDQLALDLVASPTGDEDVVLRFDDPRGRMPDASLTRGSTPLGYFLVLHDDRVAVYAPNPENYGGPDYYLTRGKPIGYLREPWSVRRVEPGPDARPGPDAEPWAERSDHRVRLHVPVRTLSARDATVRNAAPLWMVELVVDLTRW